MRIFNRRAKHDYQLFDKFEAGVVLLGTEARALRDGRGDISSAFVRIKDGEAYLVGANIPSHQPLKDYDAGRTRKLLMHRHELVSLATKTKAQNLTIVPISVYTKGPRVKLELALGKGKKQFEKRAQKRKRDIERLVEIEARGKG